MNDVLPAVTHPCSHALRRLLNPASVAVIGVSDDPLRIGGRPIAYMLAQGYAGQILPVDPGRDTVQGLAIAAMGRFGRSFAQAPTLPAPQVPAVALPDTTPSEASAKKLLAEAGIASAPEQACASVEDAAGAAQALGFPVVMKILSTDILHKSEIGGVLLNVQDVQGVREGFALLMQRGRCAAPTARNEGVLVAKQLSGGVECILGIHRDPVFGPIAMFGLGGIFVEILKDVTFRRCPFGVDVATEMIRSVKGAPLLLGRAGGRRWISRRWR